jgi:hypothetical protein
MNDKPDPPDDALPKANRSCGKSNRESSAQSLRAFSDWGNGGRIARGEIKGSVKRSHVRRQARTSADSASVG